MLDTHGLKMTGLREVAEKSNELLNDDCPYQSLVIVYNVDTGLLRSIERPYAEVPISISHLLEDGDICSTLWVSSPMTMQELADEVVKTIAIDKYRKVWEKHKAADFDEDKLTSEDWVTLTTSGYMSTEALLRFGA